MADPIPSQYEVFAAEYEDHAKVAPYNALYDRPATLALLGDVAGKRVLDAGCGPGFYAEVLLDCGAEVVGCDAAPSMVELARARTEDRASLHVHALEAPMTWAESEAFDLVLCALAYHYVNDRPAFLREVHRVLRPGGAFVLSTHHPTSDWHRLGGSYFASEAVTETWSRGWVVTAWRTPLTELTEEFAAAGFLVERLIEPRPSEAMARTHPETYAKLQQLPAFILFRLVKRST